jgi:hypothetical protein
VVPKHRRSEIEPSLASVRAPGNTAEYWPEAVGYGPIGAGAGHAVIDYPVPNGYDGADAEAGWTASPQGGSWQEQEWDDWRNWPPPPALHPDHPSAPVPRVQYPADYDYPSGQMSAPRASGYDQGNRRLHVVPNSPGAGLAGPDWQEATDFQRQHGPPLREIGRYRQTVAGWQETTDYRRDIDPYGPGRGRTVERFQQDRSPSRDSLWTAGQVLALADDRAAQIAQEAQDYAAAICDAAEREAAAITQQAADQAATMREVAEREVAAIREAAERAAAAITQQATGQAAAIRESAEQETAELRARLDSMTGELGRVAAYVTENLVAPAMPATIPPLPEATPAPARMKPALPDTAPTRPDGRPAGPKRTPTSQPHEPGTRPAKPGSAPRSKTATPAIAPRTRPGEPARQTATPAKGGQPLGRQRRAMRIATAGTAALLSIAAAGAVTYTGIHGFSFFVFRESGQGETPGNFTDAKFLARQAAAQHHDSAPKGRHHKATGSQ